MSNEAQRILDPLSQVDVIDGVDVNTQILDPITSNSSSCRFNIESRSFLQKDARLLVDISHNGAEKGLVAFNPLSGGLGVVQRVVLRYGNIVIHDIDYSGYMVARKENELSINKRNEIEKYRYYSNPVWEYNGGQLNFPSTEYENINVAYTQQGFRLALSNDSTKPSQVEIPLRKILPVFNNPLCAFPLHLLRHEYQMNLEIFWADPDEYLIVASKSGTSGGAHEPMPTITIASPQLYLNYVSYPDAVNQAYEKLVMSKNGYVVFYNDVVHTQGFVPSTAYGTQSSTTHNLQFSGREVQKINVSARQSHKSRWFARAGCKDLVARKWNFRINDAPVFTDDVNNNAWSNFLWEHSTPNERLYIHNGAYSSQLNKVNSASVKAPLLGEAYDIQGNKNWIVLDLRKDKNNPIPMGNGTLVGLNPVEFSLEHTPNNTADTKSNEAYNLHFHTEISRVLAIKQGVVEVSF